MSAGCRINCWSADDVSALLSPSGDACLLGPSSSDAATADPTPTTPGGGSSARPRSTSTCECRRLGSVGSARLRTDARRDRQRGCGDSGREAGSATTQANSDGCEAAPQSAADIPPRVASSEDARAGADLAMTREGESRPERVGGIGQRLRAVSEVLDERRERSARGIAHAMPPEAHEAHHFSRVLRSCAAQEALSTAWTATRLVALPSRSSTSLRARRSESGAAARAC